MWWELGSRSARDAGMKKAPTGPDHDTAVGSGRWLSVRRLHGWILLVRARAQLITSRPEAEVKYSRGRAALGRARSLLNGRSGGDRRVAQRTIQVVALTGAAALAIAEFAALYRVRTDVGHQIERSVSAGTHHAYALLPISVLAALLAGLLGRSGWPVPAALVMLGLAALGIVLVGDLPDVHRAGLVGMSCVPPRAEHCLGTPTTGLHDAHTVPGVALYLEALGATALLAAGAAGLIFGSALGPRSRSGDDLIHQTSGS
jgi:hypothetical protein